MDRHHDDRNTRLRSILKRMERSIDDARTRRISGDEFEESGTGGETVIGGTQPAERPGTPGFDPLDTPIADSRPTGGKPSNNGPVRDRDTMFDFDGPRLKARPKRRSAS